MKPLTTGARAFAALGAVLALLFLASRSAAVEAAYPAAVAKRSFCEQVWSRVTGFFRGSAASAENVRLRREIASLSFLRAELERAESENARLRRLLGYSPRAAGSWVAAVVLSSDGGAAGARRTLRVGKGSLAGIAAGAVVAAPEGLVGRVTRVTPHTAEISLILDPSVKVPVEVESTDGRGVRAILTALGESRLVLRHCSGDLPAAPRARVVTSGLGDVFPKGIEVGFCLPAGVVSPSVDFSLLEDVFIRRAE